MADRTTVHLVIAKADRDQFVAAFDGFGILEDESDSEGHLEMCFQEVTGGGYDILNALANAGFPFYGSHGPGIEYGPHVFAHGTSGETAWAPCDIHDDRPTVHIDYNTSTSEVEACEEDVAIARDYYEEREEAEIAISNRDAVTP